MQRSKTLGLYKQLYKHLRLSKTQPNLAIVTQTNQKNLKLEEPYVEILRNEFRQHLVSDSKYCMQKDEMLFMANAFCTYLTSTQQTLDLYAKYCRGERSIEDAAKIVGLRLPKQYEGPSTSTK